MTNSCPSRRSCSKTPWLACTRRPVMVMLSSVLSTLSLRRPHLPSLPRGDNAQGDAGRDDIVYANAPHAGIRCGTQGADDGRRQVAVAHGGIRWQKGTEEPLARGTDEQRESQ